MSMDIQLTKDHKLELSEKVLWALTYSDENFRDKIVKIVPKDTDKEALSRTGYIEWSQSSTNTPPLGNINLPNELLFMILNMGVSHS